ncbi:23S rRNA pseudouridine(1911/1915/1917) synthase RluD [Marinospirillum alkaliphilum]|uniref:Pseudouridine synthase n=1 Tax=Marinospirillum alkaliphilum DSM 21637 TaxID=1122209 RepID=A0A1K1ZPC4_9GAMM|nr:23S rRNA pseudouridine(1911/1915/1917) synthase RluD [Marinospirillum alkaliphilum]SFX75959.1 23S rRNA pseudouridine1911/1915/1917 synthase [Marinospirillum alkaliphilum DSM 21637]
MTQVITQQAEVPAALGGKRLDQVAAELFPDFSRARLQEWLKDGSLTRNGAAVKPKDKAVVGDVLSLQAEQQQQVTDVPQDIALDIVYEDDDLLVLNKAAGLVVHPAAGHADGTLLNALLFHCPQLEDLPRAGIVHRLDKDTSGLMVVAKTLKAQTALVEQLQDRSMGREYDAVVLGHMTSGGTVNAPIGRHPKDRKRQAVVVSGGKPAVTHYRVVQRYRAHTHVRCKLETGRTHQIRVHMAHVKFPLVGDPLYGGRLKLPAGAGEALKHYLRSFPRQALHARSLTLQHPSTGQTMNWTVPLPEDFELLLTLLEEDQREAR